MKLGIALPLAGEWATPENGNEFIPSLKTIWTSEVSEFHGEFYA